MLVLGSVILTEFTSPGRWRRRWRRSHFGLGDFGDIMGFSYLLFGKKIMCKQIFFHKKYGLVCVCVFFLGFPSFDPADFIRDICD